MAISSSLTLSQVESAISGILSAIADGVEEYQYNGRRVRRADYSTRLRELRALRNELIRESSYSRGGVSLGRLRSG